MMRPIITLDEPGCAATGMIQKLAAMKPKSSILNLKTNMKYLTSLMSAAAALLLVTSVSLLAQPAPGEPGGPGGRGGRGGRGGFFRPPFPPAPHARGESCHTEPT